MGCLFLSMMLKKSLPVQFTLGETKVEFVCDLGMYFVAFSLHS